MEARKYTHTLQCQTWQQQYNSFIERIGVQRLCPVFKGMLRKHNQGIRPRTFCSSSDAAKSHSQKNLARLCSHNRRNRNRVRLGDGGRSRNCLIQGRHALQCQSLKKPSKPRIKTRHQGLTTSPCTLKSITPLSVKETFISYTHKMRILTLIIVS